MGKELLKQSGVFEKKVTIEVYKVVVLVGTLAIILGGTLYMSLPWTWKVPVDIKENLTKLGIVSQELSERAEEATRDELLVLVKIMASNQINIANSITLGSPLKVEGAEE